MNQRPNLTCRRFALILTLAALAPAAWGQGPTPDYTHCADEGETCTFVDLKRVAYGASGKFFFKVGDDGIACNTDSFGGDPAGGTSKSCYVDSANIPSALANYSRCASEGETCTFNGTKRVAYGAHERFFFQIASRSIVCDTGSFGGDPKSDTEKSCYVGPDDIPGTLRDFRHCADEGQTCSFDGHQSVAYGADDRFFFKTAGGSIECNTDSFGGDPADGIRKACYVSR